MLHAGAHEHDHLHKTGMPNGGRLQMWPAVGLSRQTQHADSAYGIHRYGIVERAVSTGDAASGSSERWCNCPTGLAPSFEPQPVTLAAWPEERMGEAPNRPTQAFYAPSSVASCVTFGSRLSIVLRVFG